jgi:hypothetical protein
MNKDTIIDKYPGIKKATLIMAYANGVINRTEDEHMFLAAQDFILGAEGVYAEDLRRLDQWLCELDTTMPGALGILADGEECEANALAALGPRDANGRPLAALLDDIFDNA